jgi:hypothetical protein
MINSINHDIQFHLISSKFVYVFFEMESKINSIYLKIT